MNTRYILDHLQICSDTMSPFNPDPEQTEKPPASFIWKRNTVDTFTSVGLPHKQSGHTGWPHWPQTGSRKEGCWCKIPYLQCKRTAVQLAALYTKQYDDRPVKQPSAFHTCLYTSSNRRRNAAEQGEAGQRCWGLFSSNLKISTAEEQIPL